jgi:hypothetical protein
MNHLINALIRLGILKKDLDYHMVPFLMKDLVLSAASIYLLKQDVARVAFGVQRTRVEAPRVAVESARA